jgi:hypothetical protein
LGLLTNNQGAIAFWIRTDAVLTGVTGSGSYELFNASDTNNGTALNICLGDFTQVLEGEILGVVLGQNPNPRSALPNSTIGPVQPGWHHVAVTSSSGGHKFYWDGAEFTPTLFNAGVTASCNLWPLAATQIRIGGQISSDSKARPYAVDEVLIYKRLLDLSEIRSLAKPVFLSIRHSQVEVCWTSQTNISYQVQYRSELTTNEWVNLGNSITATNSTTCILDSIPAGEPRRFYRVQSQ